jgi:hypothetical protein
MEAESFESGAPDWIPDDLVAVYARDARKTVRHNISRRRRVVRRARIAVRNTDADLWQTTGMVFFLGIIAICGVAGLAYAVYLWPKVGLSLVGGIVVLFGFSFFMAKRITRRDAERSDQESSLY